MSITAHLSKSKVLRGNYQLSWARRAGRWSCAVPFNFVPTPIMIWLIVVGVVGFLLAVPFIGADSRDGQDWQPLRLPSPMPDKDGSPPSPAGAAKELKIKLRNWRVARRAK